MSQKQPSKNKTTDSTKSAAEGPKRPKQHRTGKKKERIDRQRPAREAARATRVQAMSTAAPHQGSVRIDHSHQYGNQYGFWTRLTALMLRWSRDQPDDFRYAGEWIATHLATETEYCKDADPTNKDWNGLIPRDTPTCSMSTSRPIYLLPAGRAFLNERRDRLAASRIASGLPLDENLRPLLAGDALGLTVELEQEMLTALASMPTPLDPGLLSLGYPGVHHGVPFYLLGESPSERALHGDGQHHWGGRFYELIDTAIEHQQLLTSKQGMHSRRYIMQIWFEAFSGVGKYDGGRTSLAQFVADIGSVLAGTLAVEKLTSPFRPLISPAVFPRPDGYSMCPGEKSMYDITLPSVSMSDPSAKARLEDIMKNQYSIMPWIEGEAGIKMTHATRSNMTYDRCCWYFGALLLLTKCGPDISSSAFLIAQDRDGNETNFRQIGLDYWEYMQDVMSACYCPGGNLAKKVKGATDDLLRLLPIPRITTKSELDPWNESGFSVCHRHGKMNIELNSSPVIPFTYVPSLDDIRSPYIDHDTGEDQWPLAIEKCKKFKLHTLIKLAEGIEKSAFPPCVSIRTAMFLNEPVSSMGILYSSHILPLLKQPLKWDKPVIRPELESAVPLFSEMIDDVIKVGSMHHKLRGIHDLLRETLAAMNTDKSSGGYKVVFEFAQEVSDVLGKTSSAKSRKVHTTGKAPTQAYLLDQLATLRYLMHKGSHLIPNAVGRRDVTGGRTARMMYMVTTGVQILQQYWYKGFGDHMEARFTATDGTCIRPSTYTPELKHQTESEKMLAGHCCSTRSEVHDGKRLDLIACFDYATMDQNSTASIDLMLDACNRSTDVSTIRIPRFPVPLTTELDDTNSDEHRIVDLMRDSLEAACRGIYAEKDDGVPNAKGSTRVGGYMIFGARPMIYLDFNPSGQLITSRLNCATNAAAFPTHTRVWGDDGFFSSLASTFSNVFRNRINRAATLGQTLVYNDCQIGCDAIFLKVRITGLTSFRRMKSIAKEHAGDPPSPMTVTAELSSAYECSSRIRNDVEMIQWLRHHLRTSGMFKGYGWVVPAPALWSISGGALPRIAGVLPISHNPIAMAAHADLLIDMYQNLGYPLDLSDGLVLSSIGMEDEVGERVSQWMVGLADVPNIAAGLPEVMKVKVRGLLPKEGDLLPSLVTIDNPLEVAKRNLTGIVKQAEGRASQAMLSRLQAIYPDRRAAALRADHPTMSHAASVAAVASEGNRTLDMYRGVAYVNSYAAQTAKVFAATISDNLTAKAIASNLATGMATVSASRLPVDRRLLGGGANSLRLSYSAEFGDMTYTYTPCGSFMLQMTTPLSGSLARVYSAPGLESIQSVGSYVPMFSLSRGHIEELMCACFGMHRDRTEKHTTALKLLVPGRGDIQPGRILELMKTLDMNELQTLLQCGALPAGYDNLLFMREMLLLESSGSMRMTGVMLDIGHEIIKHQIRCSAADANLDVLIHNMCEHLLAYHATVWSMMYTTSLLTKEPILEYPLFFCDRQRTTVVSQ